MFLKPFAVYGVLKNAKCNTSLTLRCESLDHCWKVIFIVVKMLVQINFYTCHVHVCCFLIKEVGCFKILNLTFYLILCYFDPHFPVISLTKKSLLCFLHLETFSILTCVWPDHIKGPLHFSSRGTFFHLELLTHDLWYLIWIRHWSFWMVHISTTWRCCLLIYLAVHIPDFTAIS